MNTYFLQVLSVLQEHEKYSNTSKQCFALLQDFVYEQREYNLLFCSLSFTGRLKEVCQAHDYEELERISHVEHENYGVDFFRQVCVVWAYLYKWDSLKEQLEKALKDGYDHPILGFSVDLKADFVSDLPADLPIARFGTNVAPHLMAYVSAGSFLMGAEEGHRLAVFGSHPKHRVHITKPFWMALFPCAQMLCSDVLPDHKSEYRNEYRPVESISWIDVIYFCNELSRKEGLEPVYSLPDMLYNSLENNAKLQWNQNANGYRLPTEAEWEYCAKAGKDSNFSGGDNLDRFGVFATNSSFKTSMVGEKKPNTWGFYDMSGNIFEWVWDASSRLYTAEEVWDPRYNKNEQGFRICRGGSWNSSTFECSTFYRNTIRADIEKDTIGFRLARNA